MALICDVGGYKFARIIIPQDKIVRIAVFGGAPSFEVCASCDDGKNVTLVTVETEELAERIASHVSWEIYANDGDCILQMDEVKDWARKLADKEAKHE